MKYHRLSKEDLEELREEFVTFLAAQSIRAEEWEKLKENDAEKVDRLLDQFSDMVIHRALENISALKLISEKEMYVFLFDESEASVIHLKIAPDVDYRLTDHKTIAGLSSGSIALSALKPQFEKGKKAITGDREAEMYLLMRQGAEPCPAAFFESFEKLIS